MPSYCFTKSKHLFGSSKEKGESGWPTLDARVQISTYSCTCECPSPSNTSGLMGFMVHCTPSGFPSGVGVIWSKATTSWGERITRSPKVFFCFFYNSGAWPKAHWTHLYLLWWVVKSWHHSSQLVLLPLTSERQDLGPAHGKYLLWLAPVLAVSEKSPSGTKVKHLSVPQK